MAVVEFSWDSPSANTNQHTPRFSDFLEKRVNKEKKETPDRSSCITMSWGRAVAEPENPRSSRARVDAPLPTPRGEVLAPKRSSGKSGYHVSYPQSTRHPSSTRGDIEVYTRHISVAGGWVERVVVVKGGPADMIHEISDCEGCQDVFMDRHSPSRASVHMSTLSRLLASSPRPTSATSPTKHSKPRRRVSAKMSRNPRISAPISAPISPPASPPPPSPPRTAPPHYEVLSTSFSALEDDIALHENSLYEIRGSLAAATPAALQQGTSDLLSSLGNAAQGLLILRQRFEKLSITLLRLRVGEMRRRRQHGEDDDAGEDAALESLKSHADLLQRNLKWAEDFREELRLMIDGVYFPTRDLEVVEAGEAREPEQKKEAAGKKRKGMTSIAEALEMEEEDPSDAKGAEQNNSLGNMF